MPISLSQVLSVALALAVIYYVLGSIVSAITKLILDAFNTKGKVFEGFLKRHLLGMAANGKSELLDKIKKMPQLNSLMPVRYKWLGLGIVFGQTKIVDVIERVPPKNLVDALFDLEDTVKTAKEKATAVVNLLPDQLPGLMGQPVNFEVKSKLLTHVTNQFEDLDKFRSKLETWFGGIMDQAAQEFKAKARIYILIISFLITILLGVDSINLAQKFWKNATISAVADAQASLILGSTDEENQNNANVSALIEQLEEMNAVNFWYQKPPEAPDGWGWLWNEIAKKFPGMIITTIAVSQGSSFWYDLIKRLKGEASPTSDERADESNFLKAIRAS
jgi:hypothetical protein